MIGTFSDRDDGRDRIGERIKEMVPDVPPPDLNKKIFRSIASFPAPKRPLWRKLVLLSEQPGFVLAYRAVSLATLIGLLIGVWSIVSMRGSRPAFQPPNSRPAQVATASSKGKPKGSTVTFILFAPEAMSVAVVGSFNDWDPSQLQMTKGKDGNWTAKVTLSPGQYEYQFVVDGDRFFPDPNAIEQRDDGMGGANAVLRL